jgi:hypothetical protein
MYWYLISTCYDPQPVRVPHNYADDTLIIMKASQRELFCLKGILHSFSGLTGPKVNYSKSCLLPINLDAIKDTQLAAVFSCQIGSFPFTYLGLPIGTSGPKVQDYLPVNNKIERRLNMTSMWLSMAGRLTLVNSTFWAMPIYAMCLRSSHPRISTLLIVQETVSRKEVMLM